MSISIEEMKRKIIEIIDENKSAGPKIAFYSDPDVAEIIDKLYKRWNAEGCKGKPLDYASEEEIRFLYKMALKYRNISEAEAWMLYMSREASEINPTLKELNEAEEESKKKPWWKRVFWFLVPG